ncbi:MAG: ABC transporter substrate-binding protein [Thaumarchaeota archaeon]|nr:ABC transporter substrate-binding protein [Nitrososphaerota archaeon]
MLEKLEKRGVPMRTAIGVLIVGLLIGAGIIYGAAPSIGLGGTTTVTGATATVTTTVGAGATATVTTTATVTRTATAAAAGLCNGQTVKVGALFDLSGELSNLGSRSSVAGQIAIEDVNDYLQTAGCDLTFQLVISDYALNNDRALSELQAFAAQGIDVVLGPFNSGSAQFILSYANENHIVLLSPSSTSPALAIEDDYLFRTVPNDAAQGLGVARMLADRGVEGVILVNRQDTYGDGLADATTARFEELGGKVVSRIRYDTATTDFTSILTQMDRDWQTASAQYGADKVAFEVIAFQEFGTMITQAATSFPDLLNTPQPWFGSDGTSLNGVIVDASTSGPYVAQVQLPSTLFVVANNSKTLDFYGRYTAELPGQACEFYCHESYNDVWLAALSILSAGSTDGAAVQKILPLVAATYYGTTGWEGLEPSGDRIPGSYQIWMVAPSGGQYTWILAGTWDFNTDTITWVQEP